MRYLPRGACSRFRRCLAKRGEACGPGRRAWRGWHAPPFVRPAAFCCFFSAWLSGRADVSPAQRQDGLMVQPPTPVGSFRPCTEPASGLDVSRARNRISFYVSKPNKTKRSWDSATHGARESKRMGLGKAAKRSPLWGATTARHPSAILAQGSSRMMAARARVLENFTLYIGQGKVCSLSVSH